MTRSGVPSDKEPTVELSPGAASDSKETNPALELRLRQQQLLATLGVQALRGEPFETLLDQTAHMTAVGLEAEFCKVMEYLPDQKRFLVRAGVGWNQGVIGSATVGADLESPAGFALRTGKPVISNHLENEERFRTPELLVKHGIRRAINVILQGEGNPYGVLEVDSRSAGEFSEHDLSFLQGAANILGMAIERQRMERDLKAALDMHKVLLNEVNHRVKNSLQLVATMLHFESGTAIEADLQTKLRHASRRIFAIAKAHEGLRLMGNKLSVNLGACLTDLCGALDESCSFDVVTPAGIEIAADKAIPIALIVNELATNAAKYAYPGRAGGRISVQVAEGFDQLIVSIADEGVGLPGDFDLATSRGLGMRIVQALAQQLGAEFEVLRPEVGAKFVLRIPQRLQV
jgi:two-component sensor histidine kinase